MRIRSLAVPDKSERGGCHRGSTGRTSACNDAEHPACNERLSHVRQRTRRHACRRTIASTASDRQRLLFPRRLVHISLRVADVAMRKSQCLGACHCIWCEEVPVAETGSENHQWLVEGRHCLLGDPQSTLRKETQKVQSETGGPFLPVTRPTILEDI